MLATLADAALEVPVAPSFTRIGYDVRSRLEHWTPLDGYDLAGRVVVITGATSGLGFAAARTMAGDGADLVVVGRDEVRTQRACDRLRAETGRGQIRAVVADLGELDSVRRAAREISDTFGAVDTLVHNAGALNPIRRTTSDGTEETVASQVLGPFLLTALLLPLLRGAAPARVLTMSSGGMYAASLHAADLEMAADRYRGSEQYARAKRAQVTLNELWAARLAPLGVVCHALHPGWADTPGVASSLPTFRRVVGPLLRTPGQGADTLVWLAADDGEPLASTGGFWLDRRRRPLHRLPTTRRSDTPERRAALWAWCLERTGASVPG